MNGLSERMKGAVIDDSFDLNTELEHVLCLLVAILLAICLVVEPLLQPHHFISPA